MRQLGKTELYSEILSPGESKTITNTIMGKLYNNIGDIAPEHIQTELVQLTTKSKSSYFALLSDALALYEKRGLIRLFNLGAASGGRSPIPSYMPFISAPARNRVRQSNTYGGETSSQGNDRVVYVNMSRIGNWSADESTYNGVSALTDLYSCLETGVIAYRLTVQGMADKVFNDKTVIEYLEKIYVNLLSQAIIKAKVTFGGVPFKNDCAYFIIAKFFLLYLLEKTPGDTVDDYAYLATQNRSSLEALKSFEETHMIDYSSLSSFLRTFGLAFFNDEIFLIEIERVWLKLYGEGTAFAIEYVPYLLHFLFAAFHGAMLGGSVRLYNRIDELKKLGLPKLYNAVIAAIR